MYASNTTITVLRGYCEDPDFDDLVPDNRARTVSVPVELVQDSRSNSDPSPQDEVVSKVRYLTMNVPRTLDLKEGDRFKENTYGGTYEVTDVDNMAPAWVGHKTVSARMDGAQAY